MKFVNKAIIFGGILAATSFLQLRAATDLCINEIMQSNINNLIVDHDFPDSWVELYNPTTDNIILNNYYIGLENDTVTAYRIPDATITAGGYLIICCDKEGENLHTDFRLESVNAGTLYLFNSSGEIIDQLSYPAMPAPNIGYGRASDGSDEWGWEISATPGAANKGGLSTILLPDPVFSISGRIMSSTGSVKISMPSGTFPSDTRIYYTTDGSEPTRSSQKVTSVSVSLKKSTVIRAKLISDSTLTRPSVTNSYIFHPRTTELPIISIVSNYNYLYSDTLGILAWAKVDGIANYLYDWRRPVNTEYLVKNSDSWANQLSEVAVSGNSTRAFEQKSLKVYANKRFGTKRFTGNFWEDKPNVTKTKSFVVRNGGDNCGEARINDGMIQRLFGTHASNIDYQAYSPVIVYINGVYKGIYGMRERTNDDYVEANYDGLEDIYTASQDCYKVTSTERPGSAFESFYNLYCSDSATYDQIAEQMDVDNFMEALIAEMFAVNNDYPHNNIAMWRPIKENGKWRWILKDMDLFGARMDRSAANFNMFKYMFGPVTEDDLEYTYAARTKVIEALRLYQKMISFDEFKEPFIDKFAVWLGDFLKSSVSIPIVEAMVDEIYDEVEPTFTANQDMSTITRFEDAVKSLKKRCANRPPYVYQHMADYFSLGSVIPMTLKPNGAKVKINNIGLSEGDFVGAFFSNRTLNLNSGNNRIGWMMETFTYDSDSVLVKNDEDYTFAEPKISLLLSDYVNCDSVSFYTFSLGQSEFDEKISELGLSEDSLTDWSDETTIALDEPQYAYANILCDTLPTSKTDNIHAYIDLYDNNGNYFQKKVILNLQGDSDIKNNFSVSFCEDEWIGEITPSITFGDWVAQDEFHLKGFYGDGLRGTSEIAYQLYAQITERDNCYPKAFPMSLYINGDFYGIMAWQLKKHRDNMGLNKKTAANVWLDGTLNDKKLFRDTIEWTKFEVRNPKGLYNMDGTEYDGDTPLEIIDSTSVYYTGTNKMIRSNQAKQYIIALSHYYSELKALEDGGATTEEMRAAINAKFDVPELINYMIFSLVSSNYDGFSKNWQWFTYDGIKWTVAPYDCNLTFGYNEEGTSLWPASQSSKKYDYKMENVDSNGPMYWIKNYFWEDLKERYAELRDSGIISSSNIANLYINWHNRIGNENYSEEWEAWPESPCVVNFTESTDRFEGWTTDRIALEDFYLGYTPDSLSYTLTISSAEWSTLCVPFAFEIPENINIYTVSGLENDGSTLALEEVFSTNAYKPYMVYGPAGDYTFYANTVSSSTEETSDLTNGLLTGCIIDTYAPVNSYVLQNQNSIIGFYPVNTTNTILVPAYHAYLNLPGSNQVRFRIHRPNSIRSIEQKYDVEQSIYKYWGQKTNELSSGVNIVRQSDGTYKIIIIK